MKISPNLINLSLITVRLFNRSVRRRGLRLYGPHDCFAYSVFEVAWMYRVGWGLTPFPLGNSQAPWFCHVLSRISHACVYSPRADFPQHGTRGPVFIYTGYSLLLLPQLENSSPLSYLTICIQQRSNLSCLHFNNSSTLLLWSSFLCFPLVKHTICPLI